MNPFLEDDQPLPVRKPADLDEVIIRIDDIEKRVQQCETCLKKISEQLKKMSEGSAARNELKERALKVLEKKKMFEVNLENLKSQPASTMDQATIEQMKKEYKKRDDKTEDSEDNKSDPESFGKPELDTLSSGKDEGPHFVVRDVVLKFYNKSIAMMKFFCNLILIMMKFYFKLIFTIIKFFFNQVIAVIKFRIKLIFLSFFFGCLFGKNATIGLNHSTIIGNTVIVGNGWQFSNNLWKWKWPTLSSSYDLNLILRVVMLVFRELLARDPFFKSVSNMYNFLMYHQYQDAIPDAEGSSYFF